MRYRVYSYNPGSCGARSLATAIGGRVLRHTGSTFVPRRDDVIVNWGRGSEIGNVNRPAAIAVASDKLRAFQAFRTAEVSIPPFWTDRAAIPDDAFPVVCRTILNGHSGRGIVIANNRAELVAAPLYVKYIRKQDEYRIHVAFGRVISVQRKAIRSGTTPVDTRVRNLDNGYIFVRGDVNPPAAVTQQSIMAIEALGLDFGAVDVIWNNHYQTAYVLEVNTAPGLEGTTITDYANAFIERFGR